MNVRMPPPDSKIALLVFAMVWLVFWLSPVYQGADSKYSMVLSEQFLRKGTFVLDRGVFPAIPPHASAEDLLRRGQLPYQFELVDGRIFYYFPPGTSLLSIPYVAFMNARGISSVGANGHYTEAGEASIQAELAALLMALLAAITYLTSRYFLGRGWSLLVAAGTAFGTQVWSTASRALWNETWGILLLTAAIWMLVKAETRPQRLQPVLLATLMAWLYFVRPTFCIPIVGISAYLLFYHRRSLGAYIVTGCVWLAAFVAYSRYYFGVNLPNYYRADRLTFDSFWEALAGNLISPSRGLFIYVPVLVFVGYLLVRYRRSWVHPRFVALGTFVIVAHLLVVSGFVPWFGGWCYGPRYSTGIVPWFALLGALAIATRLRWSGQHPAAESRRRWRAEFAVGAALLIISIGCNGIGGVWQSSLLWNPLPINVDEKPERVWDWSDPQFLSPFVRR